MAKTVKKEREKLTVNQDKFAREFVLTGNAAEAYRRSYPKSLNWKDKTVYSRASEMLADSKVSGRVKELQVKVQEKFDVSAERLLQEQARIALFDFRRLFDENGRLINPTNMSDDVAAAVQSVKVSRIRKSPDDPTEEDIVEVKLWNKNNSIDSLFKHKGLYEKDNAQRKTSIADMTLEELAAIARGDR